MSVLAQTLPFLNVCSVLYLYCFTSVLHLMRHTDKLLVIETLLDFFSPWYISIFAVLDINYFNNKSPEGNGKTRANK